MELSSKKRCVCISRVMHITPFACQFLTNPSYVARATAHRIRQEEADIHYSCNMDDRDDWGVFLGPFRWSHLHHYDSHGCADNIFQGGYCHRERAKSRAKPS